MKRPWPLKALNAFGCSLVMVGIQSSAGKVEVQYLDIRRLVAECGVDENEGYPVATMTLQIYR